MGLSDAYKGLGLLNLVDAYTHLTEINVFTKGLGLFTADNNVLLYSEDYYIGLFDEILKHAERVETRTIIFSSPVFTKALFGEELQRFKAEYRGLPYPTLVVSEVFLNLPYSGREITKGIGIDFEEYMSSIISFSDIAVLDIRAIEKVYGKMSLTELKFLLRDIASTHTIKNVIAVVTYLSNGTPYIIVYDIRNKREETLRVPNQIVLVLPGSSRILAEIAGKNTIVHGLTTLLTLSLTHTWLEKGVIDVRHSLSIFEDIVNKTFHYWRRIEAHGKVTYIVNPLASVKVLAERYLVVKNLVLAVQEIKNNQGLLGKYVPSAGSNLVMALPHHYARSPHDVAAPDRMLKTVVGEIVVVGNIDFGASRFLASVLLRVMQRNQRIRAALSLRYDPVLLECMSRYNWTIIEIPFELPKKKPWELDKTELILKGLEKIMKKIPSNASPIVLYYKGTIGVEPVIILLGPTAVSTAELAVKVAMFCKEFTRQR